MASTRLRGVTANCTSKDQQTLEQTRKNNQNRTTEQEVHFPVEPTKLSDSSSFLWAGKRERVHKWHCQINQRLDNTATEHDSPICTGTGRGLTMCCEPDAQVAEFALRTAAAAGLLLSGAGPGAGGNGDGVGLGARVWFIITGITKSYAAT